jgi:hypothetical protein
MLRMYRIPTKTVSGQPLATVDPSFLSTTLKSLKVTQKAEHPAEPLVLLLPGYCYMACMMDFNPPAFTGHLVDIKFLVMRLLDQLIAPAI